jgi:hypothetical protein
MKHIARLSTRKFTTLNRINPLIKDMLRAKFPGLVGEKHGTPDKTSVVRIALTGGPCAGKSSALSHLSDVVTKVGFDVILAPEVPTILFNAGIVFDHESTSFVETFQTNNLALQLQLERTLTHIAASTGRPTILILDRGLLDAKGYCDSDTWERCMSNVDINDHRATITEDYLLQRYDAVVHMDTAAKGAEKFYKHGWTTDDSGNKVFRRETPKMAIVSDDNMLKAWKSHPKHIRVKNDENGGFQKKLNSVAESVLEVALQKHPQSV